MLGKRLGLLGLAAFVWPVAAPAQVFEITRELGAPEHHYFNDPPFFTSASDVLPFPAAPNVSFAISDYSTIRLRLVAPPGKKFVATRAVYLSWPGDLNLIPVGSTNSGTLHPCPTSWSFTTLAGTAPVSTVEGYKTDADWLKIRATGTSASSVGFEFTEIVLEWNVAGISGSSHTYAMSDAGGWITGPEMTLYETLASGAPDPGPAVFLQDIAPPCFTDIAAGLPGVNGAVDWGDYDNDGDLDLLLSGTTGATYTTRIFRSSGGTNPTFSDASAGLPGVAIGDAAWGDYDNDGDLDIVLTGLLENSTTITRVFRNSGGPDPTFSDAGAGLPGLYGGLAAWGDYDNDGDLDLLLAGWADSTAFSRVYRNNGNANPTFSNVSGSTLFDLQHPSGGWGDYDNDGDLDILLTGGDGNQYYSTLYRNSGGTNATFSAVSAGLPFLGGGGSAAWGDYDNDGDLDILLTGQTVGPPGPFSRVYRNSGGANPTFSDAGAGLVASGPVAWGDYDNDGDLDLLLAVVNGFSGGIRVYRNSGGANPTFSDAGAELPPLLGDVAWGDYDNDGDLDFVLSGQDVVPMAKIYRTDCAPPNSPPAAPTNLIGTAGEASAFSWSTATDAQTPASGLSYNLRVGTSPGASNIVAPMANTATGWRRVAALGNANENSSWDVELSGPGTYYWSVQTIDGAFAGSTFATEQVLNVPPSCFTDIGAGLAGTHSSSVSLGDYDNDGDLDILMTGAGLSETILYRSSGGPNPTFANIGAGLPATTRGSVAWGDYDNDGDLDILLAGDGMSRVYQNSGGPNPTFSDSGVGLEGVQASAVAWGDYDNDDDLDILLTGDGTSLNPITKVYRNSGGPNPTFSDSGNSLFGIGQGSVAWGDYDNDGDLDIALTGRFFPFVGFPWGAAKVFRNNGGPNPTFSDLGVPLTGVYNSSVAWGDYDNDGDQDLLLAGLSNSLGSVTTLYRNSGGPNPTFTDVVAELPGIGHTASGSVAWGDYDKDGHLDILLAGGNGASGLARVYRNSGGVNPTFTRISAFLPQIEGCALAWGDLDNDADLDIVLTGVADGSPAGISRLYRNGCALPKPMVVRANPSATLDGPNTPPTAPTDLYGRVDGTLARFSWTPATDSQTPSQGLSYNLRVGTSPGAGDIVSPMTNPLTGYRHLPVLLGNVNQNTSWEIVLPGPGTYYWSVQAVDGAAAGSPFAIEEIPVGVAENSGPLAHTLESTGPNPFSGATTIQFSQPLGGWVSLVIYDIKGHHVRTVVNESLGSGSFTRSWDGKDDTGRMVGAGIYFIRMQTAAFEKTHKIVLLR